jgi:hypothetical protein
MAARHALVVGVEEASHDRPHAQDLEEVPGHELAPDPLGLSPVREAEAHGIAGDHAREDLRLVAQVAVHGIGEGGFGVERAHRRPPSVEDDELLGVPHGQ